MKEMHVEPDTSGGYSNPPFGRVLEPDTGGGGDFDRGRPKP